MIEFIWYDVDNNRVVVILLDQHVRILARFLSFCYYKLNFLSTTNFFLLLQRQKMVAVVPQHLIHLYNDSKLLGGFFSLFHFQIEPINNHEYPKFQNYDLIYTDKKIMISDCSKLSPLTITIPKGVNLYLLVPFIQTFMHDRRPHKFIVGTSQLLSNIYFFLTNL